MSVRLRPAAPVNQALNALFCFFLIFSILVGSINSFSRILLKEVYITAIDRKIKEDAEIRLKKRKVGRAMFLKRLVQSLLGRAEPRAPSSGGNIYSRRYRETCGMTTDQIESIIAYREENGLPCGVAYRVLSERIGGGRKPYLHRYLETASMVADQIKSMIADREKKGLPSGVAYKVLSEHSDTRAAEQHRDPPRQGRKTYSQRYVRTHEMSVTEIRTMIVEREACGQECGVLYRVLSEKT